MINENKNLQNYMNIINNLEEMHDKEWIFINAHEKEHFNKSCSPQENLTTSTKRTRLRRTQSNMETTPKNGATHEAAQRKPQNYLH